MNQVFPGSIRLPGDGGAPLAATMSLAADEFTLQSGDEVLGSWRQSSVMVQRDRDGAFLMTLGGEDVYFTPESPSEFATAVTLPLQPDAGAPAPAAPESEDEPDAFVAVAKPLRSVDDDDDILSPRLLTGIVAVSVLLALAVFGVFIVA